MLNAGNHSSPGVLETAGRAAAAVDFAFGSARNAIDLAASTAATAIDLAVVTAAVAGDTPARAGWATLGDGLIRSDVTVIGVVPSLLADLFGPVSTTIANAAGDFLVAMAAVTIDLA